MCDLPAELRAHLDLQQAYEPPIGFSMEKMLLLPGGYDGQPAVLKYSERFEVYEEGEIYRWLEGKLPVPKVYLNQKIGDLYYLVVSLEAGHMLSDFVGRLTKPACLKLFASLLAQIHQVDTRGFPFRHGKKEKLAKARRTVLNHEAKTQYFERELQGYRPEDILAYLEAHQDFEEDLVFTHGDVCFPNFLYHDDLSLASVLDVSGAGINDRHLDLAIGLRTLRYNFEQVGDQLTKQDIQLFLETYGLQTIDIKKITFYILLDEITNG